MQILDYIVIFVFFLILSYIALRSIKDKSTLKYWLNNRSSGLWLLTFSHVASITIAAAVVGVVAAVYESGISFAISSVIAVIVGMIVLALVAKKISQIPEEHRFTLVDVFKWRFGKSVKYPIFFLLITVLFLLTAVNIVAVTQLGSILTGLDYNVFLLISFVVVILYTTIGGMKTDLLTDSVQFWFMGAMLIMLFSAGFLNNGFNLILELPKTHFDPFAFGGIGFLVGTILIGGFVYLLNSATWQRVFSAKSKKIGIKSLYLSIPFMAAFSILIMGIGLFAAAMLKNVNPDQALYLLIIKLLPPGLIGLGYAGILSIILSSVDSLLVGGSTIISREFSKSITLKNARLTTLVLGVIATLTAFLFPNIINLVLFASFLMIALVPCLLFGLYSKRVNYKQALVSMIGATIVLIISSFFIYKIAFIPAALFGIIAFYIPMKTAKNKTEIKESV